MFKPVVLVVLDGWGISKSTPGNAIARAKLPTIEKLEKYYPQTALQSSGVSVGLPWGEMGNSEVGHMALGAGRVIYQSLPRITLAIQDGSFFVNEGLLTAVGNAKKNDSALHLMGLASNGGVHSFLPHIYALMELAKNNGLKKVYLHLFTDGRDAPPKSGINIIGDIQERLKEYPEIKIATLCGRYFAMDRNNNWDRIQAAYDNLTSEKFQVSLTPAEYLSQSYKEDITDEFVKPARFTGPEGIIKDNDSVIFFNYREDRARQITKAFVVPGFEKFPVKSFRKLRFTTMTMYEEDLPTDVAFPPVDIKNTLGEILSKNNKKQLRIAETEKYAHVTYFFNGGDEEPFTGEKRILVPSKAVSSYAEIPEMSAEEITLKIESALEKENFDFMLINYANADMVGHTGDIEACTGAVEFMDSCLGSIIKKTLLAGGCLFITSDHGNAEEMFARGTGEADTKHSTNPVPLWYVTPDNHREKTPDQINLGKYTVGGILSDVAPTVLEVMEIKKPPEMTGKSLLAILK